MFGSSTSFPSEVQTALGKSAVSGTQRFPLEYEEEFREMQAASSAGEAALVWTAMAAGLLFHLLLIAERQMLGLKPTFFLFRGFPETLGLLLLLLVSGRSKLVLQSRVLVCTMAAGAVAALVAGVDLSSLSALLVLQGGIAGLMLVFGCLSKLPIGWTAMVAGEMLTADVLSLSLSHGGFSILRMHALEAPVFAAAFAVLCASTRSREARRDFLTLRNAAMADAPAQVAPAEESRHLDPQTRIANREAFEIRLRSAWEQATQRRNSVALLMFSIDHFPEIKRSLGNQFAETVQSHVAKSLKEGLRRSDDMVARFDMHHFVVMLPGVGAEGATQIAERLRGSIEDLVIFLGAERRRATVTVGVASLRARRGTERQKLIDGAAAALEQGRHFGTNLVFVEGRGCLPSMV